MRIVNLVFSVGAEEKKESSAFRISLRFEIMFKTLTILIPYEYDCDFTALICYFFLLLMDNFILFFFCLHIFPANERDLGNVCQSMWNAADDNLKIGKEIVIYTGSKRHPLITVTKLGRKKLQREIFVKFKGNSFLSSVVLYKRRGY